jgi:hypothetical protein
MGGSISLPDKRLMARIGGEGGIRTPDTVARMPHFECGAFNHSATSPEEKAQVVQAVFSGGATTKQAVLPARCGV